MYHNFSIHSSVDGHLVCFHVLAIAKNAVMNTGVHVKLCVLISSMILSLLFLYSRHSITTYTPLVSQSWSYHCQHTKAMAEREPRTE